MILLTLSLLGGSCDIKGVFEGRKVNLSIATSSQTEN